MQILSQIETQSHDEDGDSGVRTTTTIARVGKVSADELRELVDDYFPPEHCQHEHDCCGQWYQHFTADIEQHGELAIITCNRIQNI